MFDLTNRALADLLAAINESGVASFHLKTADYEISVSCLGSEDARDAPAPPAPDATAPPAPETPAPAATEATPSSAASERSPDEPLPDTSDAVSVLSPMVGTFYAAPEPGAPPYIQVGDRVTPDSTVGLVEAMKVFTAVSAGEHGVVAKVLVGNGDFVEYGQPLLTLASVGET